MSRNFCLDIGGSFIKLGIGSGQELTEIGSTPTPGTDYQRFLESLTQTLVSGGMNAADRLGLSIAGSIDADSGAIRAVQLPFLATVDLIADLRDRLTRQFGRPPQHEVVAQNDADCFALAEACFGSGRDRDNVFAIILGTGVGGAQVYRKRLVSGFAGTSGEWGHGPFVQRQDPVNPEFVPRIACSCGQSGCINSVGGARGLEAIHLATASERIDSRQILSGWASGEATCGRSVRALVSILSDALAVTLNVTGAEVVPVGGGLSTADQLLNALNEATQRKVLHPRPDPLLVKGQFGKNGGLWGIHARMLEET